LRKTTTLAFGYLMGDREEIDIVAPKWYGCGDLVCHVSIVAEEIEIVLKNLHGGN
jgi:hypothetical protein